MTHTSSPTNMATPVADFRPAAHGDGLPDMLFAKFFDCVDSKTFTTTF